MCVKIRQEEHQLGHETMAIKDQKAKKRGMRGEVQNIVSGSEHLGTVCRIIEP